MIALTLKTYNLTMLQMNTSNQDIPNHQSINIAKEPNQDIQNLSVKVTDTNPKKQGNDEAERQKVMQSNLQSSKLNALSKSSTNVLYKLTSVFPFTFFPTDVIINPDKVTVVFRNFLFSKQIHSIFIKDILVVEVATSPFFASLRLVDKGMRDNELKVSFLPQTKALKAQRVIQGLIVASKQGIELSSIEVSDVLHKVENIGRAIPA